MTEHKLHCSVQKLWAPAVDFTNEIFDIVHALAASLKLRAKELLNKLALK